MVLPLQPSHILLVDPDVHVRETVAGFLRRAGHRVTELSGLPEGSRRGSLQDYDAVVLGLAWPEREQPKRLRSVKKLAGQAPVLVLCAPDRVELGVGALSHGADDYLLRPPHEHELKVRLERLLDRREMDSRIAFFQNELSKRAGGKSFEVRSPKMRAVLERVLRVAPMRSTVLVYGESGVGKELVARSIHFNSPRRERAFIALNCAAMPANLIESELFGHEKGSFTGAHTRSRGKFEMAHQGTLFLDEIGELHPVTQAKLLRVLEEREFMRVGGSQSIRVDVRVIAATNADLESMVLDASFRQDLYYRLKVVTITVPPLRERRPDIPSLVNTFLDELSRANAVNRKTLTPQAMTALQDYHWPGNVRELKNLLESALVSVTGDVIRLEDLPRAVRQERAPRGSPELTPGTTLAELERVLILRTLEHTGGNRTHSAALLGIGVRTLQRKIQSYGIDIPSKRRRPHRRSKVTRVSS